MKQWHHLWESSSNFCEIRDQIASYLENKSLLQHINTNKIALKNPYNLLISQLSSTLVIKEIRDKTRCEEDPMLQNLL